MEKRIVCIKGKKVEVLFYRGKTRFCWNGKSWFRLDNLAKALGVKPSELRKTVRA